MSSSAAWPSGSRTRWAGSGGRLHRRPEGRAPASRTRSACRALGVSQSWFYKWAPCQGRDVTAPGGAAGPAGGRGQAAVRRPRGQARLPADHRRPARRGLAGQREHRRGADARAGPGGPAQAAAQGHHPARAGAGGGPRTWSGATSPPPGSTASGTATAPRSPPTRASCTWPRCWTWPPAGSSGSPCPSTTTPPRLRRAGHGGRRARRRRCPG